jgi:RNA polymerase sigma factor (sigma-70 family)
MSIENLTALYEKVYIHKVRIMSRILKGDMALAEDVVQEAFTRAVKYIHLYDETRGMIETWFNAILFNALRDVQKSERNQQEIYKEISLHDVLDPAKSILTPEYKQDLYKHIQMSKNEKHRRILELFFLYGYSSKEISEIEEGMTQSNVTTIVMRFRSSLHTNDFRY